MTDPTPLPRPGLRLSLDWAVRPLVAEVRAAVLPATEGPSSAGEMLAAAPPLACQTLADLWAEAGSAAPGIRAGLTDDEQLILDMVIHTFPPARTRVGNRDLTELAADAFIAGVT